MMEIDSEPKEATPMEPPTSSNTESENNGTNDIIDDNKEDDEREELCSDLEERLENAMASLGGTAVVVPLLTSILEDPRYGPMASSIKERAIYALARTYCAASEYDAVLQLLTGSTAMEFFAKVTRAKCAKIVRGVLDTVCALSPDQLDMQAQICKNIIEWAKSSKRTFLRQRVEAKLASIYFLQNDFKAALKLVNELLTELKKLDDKQLLVETHLVESKIHHGLRNIPKAKSALTASRTAANAIYVAPNLQSQIDSMSGVLHCEEQDYNTAHSYFLEAFEQLDQLSSSSTATGTGTVSGTSGSSGTVNDTSERATKALKYMMLCRILDALGKALKTSSDGSAGGIVPGAKVDESRDVNMTLVTGKQSLKYAGKDIEAMQAIVTAASSRSLQKFEETLQQYPSELQDDILINHHLHILHQQLMESNLIRIIEPYSCVETSYVAELIELPVEAVEKKLSQMILDGKFRGILDQGKGQLIVYEETTHQTDSSMEKGLKVIENMDKVVTSLFTRSRSLRTMMV